MRSRWSAGHLMKIATFNINNIKRRLPNLLQWLKAARPDIVCLQELKCTDREFPAEAIRLAGYHAIWRGQRTWNGVAILSRGHEPIVTRTALPGDPNDTEARYLEAAIAGLLVGCIYLPTATRNRGQNSTTNLRGSSDCRHTRADYCATRSRSCWRATSTSPRPRLTSIRPHHGTVTHWCSPRAALPTRAWSTKAGRMRSGDVTASSASTRSGTICAIAGSAMLDLGLTIFFSAQT